MKKLPPTTDEQKVFKLAKRMCTNVEIADIMGCDESTIRRKYAEVLQKARAVGKANLRQAQLKYALQGNATLLIFLGKQILGQKETMEITHEGLVEEHLDFIGMPDKKHEAKRRFEKFYN